MSGMLVMSPKQIKVAKNCYTPSAAEIETANDIIQAADEAEKEGRGIVIVKGNFISPPTLKQARKLIVRSEEIKKFEAIIKDGNT